MEKTTKDFLFKLLETPSPSGDEASYQKEWLKYVKKFAKVETDLAGNAIGILNPTAKFKVLLSGHCDEIGMIVSKIEDNGYIRFEAAGGVDPRVIIGLKVDIFGFNKTLPGVIGYTRFPRDTWTNKLKCRNLYIDCGIKDPKKIRKSIKPGDYMLYRSKPEIIGENMLVCKALDNKTGSFIVAEVLRKLSKKKLNVGVYAVSSTGEETNMRGAYYAASEIKPDLAFACDVTFNSDTPGEDNLRPCTINLGEGPALSEGSPINKQINKLFAKAAKRLKKSIQYELTPDRTHTDADALQFTGTGVPVALCSLPIRYMHSPIEIASMKDIENEIDILVEMIAKLTGEEELRPVKP